MESAARPARPEAQSVAQPTAQVTSQLQALSQHQAAPQLQVASKSPALLIDIYRGEVGVLEASGRNDGSRIAEYLRYCGLDEGYAWCAAFVSWCHGQAGYAEPRNAWSPALFPKSKVIWKPDWNAKNQQQPQPGDVFGIFYRNLQRIAHVGFVDRWGSSYCITVEGNTGPDGPEDPDVSGDFTTTHRPPTTIRFADNDLVGYVSNRQPGVSIGYPWKRSGLGLPETIGNELQRRPYSRQPQTVSSPANPIRAGPEGVHRKRRPIQTIYAVARWTQYPVLSTQYPVLTTKY